MGAAQHGRSGTGIRPSPNTRLVRGGLRRPPNARDLARADRGLRANLVAFDSAFGSLHPGDANAIDDSAKRAELFNGRAAATCVTRRRGHARRHLSPTTTFTTSGSDRAHNVVALAGRRSARQLWGPDGIDRAAIQTDMSALGDFSSRSRSLTSPLQDIRACATCSCAPYFHDGSRRRSGNVNGPLNKALSERSVLDEDIHRFALSEREIDDVVAFLA